ncbi:MAG: sulfite exporter TauE/SafE family protein [Polyangiaceae bacterium]
MSVATAVMLFLAALAGTAINSVAGGGSFIAFPALLFAGVPPVTANATNSVALWPGSVASAFAYRRELHGVRGLVPLSIASFVGGVAGSILLLETEESAFVVLIPWLMLFAATLFTFGGPIARKLRGRMGQGGPGSLAAGVLAQLVVGVYGGYFGGGMGIMMLAILTVLGMTEMHEMNAVKTVLGALVNGVAVAAFVIAGAIAWAPGLVMVVGGIVGGYAGAAAARRVAAVHVRRVVLAVAWSMTLYFFIRTYAQHRGAAAEVAPPGILVHNGGRNLHPGSSS